MKLALAIIALALTACAGNKPKQPIEQPAKVISVPVKVYVPIDQKLTEPCPIATGKLSDVIEVARKRKAALEQCNAQLKAIGKQQGAPQ